MDVLKDKQKINYDYISRYTSFPFYYNTLDDKYIYGLTSQLRESSSYVAHKVGQADTLDSLSFKYYGRPDYYWIIADFNRIQDPFIKLYNNVDIIKIPNLNDIAFK